MKRMLKTTVSLITAAGLMLSMTACMDKDDDDPAETSAGVEDNDTTEDSGSDTEEVDPSEEETTHIEYEILAMNDTLPHPSCMVTNPDPVIFHDTETGLDLEVTFYGTIIYYLEDESGFSEDIREDVAQRAVDAFDEYVRSNAEGISYADFASDYGFVEDFIDQRAAEAEGVTDCFITIGGISLSSDSQTAYDEARL